MAANSGGENIYTDGSYFAKTGGTWHLEDSPSKARWIVSMLARHVEVKPNTICEIGCGAGGILAELQKMLSDHITFTGYDISPQAHALSARFSNPRCQFILGDAFADRIVEKFGEKTLEVIDSFSGRLLTLASIRPPNIDANALGSLSA